jgi:hypothetical protein
MPVLKLGSKQVVLVPCRPSFVEWWWGGTAWFVQTLAKIADTILIVLWRMAQFKEHSRIIMD